MNLNSLETCDILIPQKRCPHTEDSLYSQRFLDTKSGTPILKHSDLILYHTSCHTCMDVTWEEDTQHSSAVYPEMINWTWGENKPENNYKRNKQKSFVRKQTEREVSIWREHDLLSSSPCSFPEQQRNERSHFAFHCGGDFTKLNYITLLHWLLL